MTYKFNNKTLKRQKIPNKRDVLWQWFSELEILKSNYRIQINKLENRNGIAWCHTIKGAIRNIAYDTHILLWKLSYGQP